MRSPPAITVENRLEQISREGFNEIRAEELLSKIPSDSLIKTDDGKTLIPLSPENFED